MTENEIKQKLMDYLYEEMDDTERAEFEQYLGANPGIQKELDELRGVRRVLQEIPAPEQSGPVMAEALMAGSVSKRRQQKSGANALLRYILPIAAIFLATVLTFSFVNLQIGSNENGFYVHFGEVPAQQEPGITEEDLVNLLNQIRNENAVFAATMIEQSQVQQAEQLEEALNVLSAYYDQRRRQDLLLVAEGLSQLEEETYYRFLQTDEALGEIIYALSNTY